MKWVVKCKIKKVYLKLPLWIKHVFGWHFSSNCHQFNNLNLNNFCPAVILDAVTQRQCDSRNCAGNLPHTTAHHCSLLSLIAVSSYLMHMHINQSTSIAPGSKHVHLRGQSSHNHTDSHTHLWWSVHTDGHAHMMSKRSQFAQMEFCACQLLSMETLMNIIMRWWRLRFTLQTNKGLALHLHSLFCLIVQ